MSQEYTLYIAIGSLAAVAVLFCVGAIVWWYQKRYHSRRKNYPRAPFREAPGASGVPGQPNAAVV